VNRRAWNADRVADLLWGAALLLGTIAVGARWWPANVRARALPPLVPAVVPVVRQAPPVDPALVDAVTRSDVFAPGHTAPRVRWAPPSPDTLPPGLAPDPAAADALPLPNATLGAPNDSSAGGEPPRFYGTVIDPRGASALLWLDRRVPGAQLYREGDRAGGWRVLRVEADRVTLASSDGGRVTLRLRR
jgi:hypothetical protein